MILRGIDGEKWIGIAIDESMPWSGTGSRLGGRQDNTHEMN
jgi:hypothetical protein